MAWLSDREPVASGKHGHYLALLFRFESVQQLRYLLSYLEFPSFHLIHGLFPFRPFETNLTDVWRVSRVGSQNP